MHIQHVEIGNFRKLKAVRVDFATDKTVFVGANNSGKTSAMDALRRFLVDPTAFTITDLTLSNWKTLNDAAARWEAASNAEQSIPPVDWNEVLPFLDVWLHVEMRELHHVQKLLPTLDWTGGILGVRLRFEPKDADVLQSEYLKARKQIAMTLNAGAPLVAMAPASERDAGGTPPTATGATPASTATQFTISLWPKSMVEFLERRLRTMFTVQAYLLDPTKLRAPTDGQALPQTLAADASALDGDPFKGLISIDEIRAQRGFGQIGKAKRLSEEEEKSERAETGNNKRLSTQLRSYYANHLDPYDTPEPQDLEALQALEGAAVAFDTRLKACFASALKELEDLGYPGITDPKLTISTRLFVQRMAFATMPLSNMKYLHSRQ